jgi:hypothetical protein
MKAQPTTKQLIEMLYERLPELFDRAAAQPAPVQPVAWVPVTETLLHEQHAWLYETMWIAMKDGRVLKGRYEWRQGRKPDRFYSDGAGDEWAYDASHVMPLQAPAHPSTTPPAQPAPVQERTDYAVHLNHCNIGECEGVCKYLDDDCPALKHADMKAKWDRPTPPAAQRQWVELTDEEKNEITWGKTVYEILELAEAKLKEKNT